MIRFSIETLYHFSCDSCKKWFSIGDWQPVLKLVCPHCGEESDVAELPKDFNVKT